MLLEAHNISKSFRDRVILSDVSLSFNTGEVVGLLGPNGAGKTTLFLVLSGIIRATSGDIILANRKITSLKMYQKARAGLVYLPQDPSIFRGLSVEDNIRAILQISKLSKADLETRLDELLEAFSIEHLRKAKATLLSGGERRRLEIARAFATRPSFLMLDEPFSGVDPISISDISEIIKNLKESKIGVILTDHNVVETLKVIDRGYVIAGGHILANGTPDEISGNQEVRMRYLGSAFAWTDW
ncbi:MAG: LPS export ABC transporter ATP-binding protein [Holosporales bacterium]|jgi:lipopolysaccharide export system ATP-binding protein|nr:LPS export ABC transporter ATP-binding protein [Holosporales bacterium]